MSPKAIKKSDHSIDLTSKEKHYNKTTTEKRQIGKKTVTIPKNVFV